MHPHAERGDDHRMAQDPWERTRPRKLSVRRQTMHPHAERGDDHQMAQDPWERTRPRRLSVRRQTMHPHAERGDDHQMAQDPWERTRPRRLSVRRRTCIVCTGLFADKSAPTGLRSSPLSIVPARGIDHAGVGFCRRRRSLACRRRVRGRVRPQQPSNQAPPRHLMHRARRVCCRCPADRRQAGLLRPPARIKNQQHHHDRSHAPRGNAARTLHVPKS